MEQIANSKIVHLGYYSVAKLHCTSNYNVVITTLNLSGLVMDGIVLWTELFIRKKTAYCRKQI